MPAFTDSIGRTHTVRLTFADGFAPECIRQSGLYDIQDNTFEHTFHETEGKAHAVDLPSGRHKTNQVTLTLLETGGVRQHFADIQNSHGTTSFTYRLYDYENVQRDSGQGNTVRVIHTKLDDTERNSDGPVTVTVVLSVLYWTAA